jgi:hypothetical protein
MTDGAYEAKVGMELNAPLDISRILRVAGGEEDGAGSQLAASPGETALMRIIRKVVTTILWKIRTWPTRFAGAWCSGAWFLVCRIPDNQAPETKSPDISLALTDS